MRKILLSSSSFVAALLLASASLAGCGDTGSPSNDFSSSCSLCVNGTPIGQSADMESCSAWGAEFDCRSADLENEGMCGDVAATCQVSECVSNPVGCSLAE